MPAREAILAAVELLGVLSAMHGRGLIHRDLKPSNVMMTADGVRLIDFGLAARHLAAEELTGSDATLTLESETGQSLLCGTPGYISPEQVRGLAATPLSDLFAMGAVLFEMLTSKPAFPGASVAERLGSVLHSAPPTVADSAEARDIDGLIRRALAKTPSARFGSATEFAEALRQSIAPLPSGDVQTPQQTRILVLPFRALREDAETAFLSRSLPEAITCELAAFAGLQVRSSMVGMRYAGEAPDLRAIAVEAAVDIAVTGTLLRVKDQIRVSTQLLQVPAGTVVSTSSFQSGVDDLFELQDQAVRRIVAGLGPLNTATEPQRDVPKAGRGYEFYLRANLAAQDRVRMAEARDLYLQCLDLDPEYAPAWARLGRCYRVGAKYLQKPPEGIALAKEALERAVSLNPDLDLAQSMYAQMEADVGAPLEGLRRLLRTGAKHPQSADVFAGLTYVCRFCGLLEESVLAHRKARRLDPTAGTSVTHTYFQQRAYLWCLETCAEGIGYADALALDGLGQTAAAISRTEDRIATSNSSGLGEALLSSLLAVLKGEGAGVRAMFEEALRRFWLGPEEKYYFARHVIRAGDLEWGMAELESAVRGGYYAADSLAQDPWLSAVSGTGEFQRLVLFASGERDQARAIFVECGGPKLVAG